MSIVLNAYIGLSVVAFFLTGWGIYNRYDNYFAFGLAYWSSPITSIALYNFCLAMIVLIQQVTVLGVFDEMKENEKIKILQKLKLRGIEIMFAVLVYHDQFTFVLFLVVLLLVLTFVLHHLMVLRAEYLINTHNPQLTHHYKILVFFAVMIFIDLEVIRGSYKWIFAQGGLPVIFLFYITKLFLMSLEPFLKLATHTYERFTMYEFRNLDYRMSIVSFAINLPRLIVLVVFVMWIMARFRFSIFFLFTMIELLVELVQLIKGFRKMNELTQTMENLPKIYAAEFGEEHDNICMVCFREMEEGRKLPCNHIFHEECLKQWIQKNTNHFCPKCKRPFDFDKTGNRITHTQRQPKQDKDNPLPPTIELRLPIHGVSLPRFQKLGEEGVAPNEQQDLHLTWIEGPNAQQLKPDMHISSQQKLQQQPEQPIQPMPIGSLPYCLPTEAVYERTQQHFAKRNKLREFNAFLTSTLAYPQKLQMLIIPE